MAATVMAWSGKTLSQALKGWLAAMARFLVGEVRQGHAARFGRLAKDHIALRPMHGPPITDTPLQRSMHSVGWEILWDRTTAGAATGIRPELRDRARGLAPASFPTRP